MEKGLDGGKMRKQNSWSPNIERDETWERRRRGLLRKGGDPEPWLLRRAQSVTDDDLDELRGCIDLGFGFEPPAACRSRLVETLPAMDLYYAAVAVKGRGGGGAAEGCTSEPSPIGSPLSILSLDDPPETVKMRLKQWAQVVALSLRSRS